MADFPIISKLPNSGTTIFTIMSALANQCGAINLSQGFPDFDASEELIALVNSYMRKNFNQYAPMQGILPLRERIAEKTEELYGAIYNPDTEITITSGGTQAIYTAITAMIREGDEVIVLEPAYDSYVPAIELAGGTSVFVPLRPPTFKPDWELIRNAVTPATKMILINSPHNPMGSVLDPEDMKELEKIVFNSAITIVSDEVYEHIIFDGLQHESIFRYPALAKRSFVVFSFGKTYHTTGWKMGYCLAPAALMKEFRNVHQFVVFSSNTPIQFALADFMKNKNYLFLPEFYQAKRDYFLSLLSGSKFKFTPASGSYFQLLDYSSVSDEKDTEYASRLTKEIGVASIPVSVFYRQPVDNKLLRFCFAKKNETLEKAAERLHKI